MRTGPLTRVRALYWKGGSRHGEPRHQEGRKKEEEGRCHFHQHRKTPAKCCDAARSHHQGQETEVLKGVRDTVASGEGRG